ncbi:ATP-binding cassette sub-family C member 9-like isoform X2 [Ptychodera flava]|uniref:ATP-binding cassette sub-family C member 9-like isoform X2 n=1 Tax=Ptychodera flava TaxID=63121 RepID=UPI00396A1821
MASTADICYGNSTRCTGSCWKIDVVYGGVHTAFLLLFAAVRLTLGCCTQLRHYSSKTLIPYPGHKRKWIFTGLLFLVLLCAVSEGILTDLTRNSRTQPTLYVPQSCALLCTLMGITYYHYTEYWNKPSLIWLLILYWSSSFLIDVFRLSTLMEHTGFDVSVLRLDVIVISIVIYACLLISDINLIRTKVFKLCHSEKESYSDLQKDKMFYLYNYNNLLSRAMFSTLNWLLVLGYKRPLEVSDLGCLPEHLSCKNIYRRFEEAYKAEKERTAKKSKTPSLLRVYVKAYGVQILTGVFIKAMGDTCMFIPPLAVGGIVSYATKLYYNEEQTIDNECYVTVQEFFSNGFVLLLVTFIAIVVRAFLMQYGGNILDWTTIYARTAIQAFIYDKSLRLSTWSLSSGDMAIGQITNHMSVDALSIHWFTLGHIWIWPIPYQITVVLVLLYIKMGISAIIGALLLIFIVPLQLKITSNLARIQDTLLEISDSRLKKINELLQGIKLLKLYGWEEMFCSAIEVVREKQIKSTIKFGGSMILLWFTSDTSYIVITFLSFIAYSFISQVPLTPDLAFVALALFNQLTIPLTALPHVLTFFANGFVSFKRLDKFFISQEIDERDNGLPPMKRGFDDIDTAADFENHLTSTEEPNRDKSQDGLNGGDGDDLKKSPSTLHSREEYVTTDSLESEGRMNYGTFNHEDETQFIDTTRESLPEHVALQIVGGTFSWDHEGSSLALTDINVQVPVGSLVMVIGLVGSGKSSLLSSMLGEMTTINGSVEFNSKKNHVSYVPQKAWLQNATLRDNILFGKEFDQTRYQKVIEACALQPDIDILPAGDMTEIGEKGINLSGGQKQRVSVARAIYSNADIVLLDDPLSALDVHVGAHLMEHGIIDLLVREGRTVILVTHHLQYLHHANKVILMEKGRLAQEGDLNKIKKHDPVLFAAWEGTIRVLSESDRESDDEHIDDTEKERVILNQQISKTEIQTTRGSSGALIEKEERERGSVSWRVYLAYAKAIKYYRVVLIFLLLAGQAAALMLSHFWLSAWSEVGVDTANKTQVELDEEVDVYRRGYTVWTLSFVALTGIVLTCQILSAIYAARLLHVDLLRNIIHAPLRFFDTTPIGRILNRFSNDTQIIDLKLWTTWIGCLYTASLCISAIIVNAIVTPIFLVAVTPLLVAYYFVQRYFVATSRELQRLDSITKSPLLSHFSETLGGLPIIRAYRDEKRFRRRLLQAIDTNNVAQLYILNSFRWLTVRLEIICAMVILLAGLGSLVTCMLGDLQPSLVGLSLTYALSICSQLNWMVRMFAESEMFMNSVERVLHYSRIHTEEYRGTYAPPAAWPDKGNIKFENVSVRYATDLDAVLEDISLDFKSCEKIGICGRTGSGKSSLTLAVFRLIETFAGRITIDGIDISQVPLLTLRSRLVVIPQDPVLFAGTIRFNLDPLSHKSDDQLWEALEISRLKEVVANLDNQLDSYVSEDGDNFSVGQRQLFCLARAFLRNAKILIMDEATASVDMETDAALQNIISDAFADRTVITIAHRISSILDSDSVLVLSEGKVIEYGSPKKLLNQDGSAFSSLVNGE